VWQRAAGWCEAVTGTGELAPKLPGFTRRDGMNRYLIKWLRSRGCGAKGSVSYQLYQTDFFN